MCIPALPVEGGREIRKGKEWYTPVLLVKCEERGRKEERKGGNEKGKKKMLGGLSEGQRFFKDFIYLFLERGAGKKRGGETLM